MDLKSFYLEYLNDQFLVDLCMENLKDDYFISRLSDEMKPMERNFILKLAKKSLSESYHEVEYDTKKYPNLIENNIILDGGNNELGVLHSETVQIIAPILELKKEVENENRLKDPLKDFDRIAAEKLAENEITQLYNSYKLDGIKSILKTLGSDYSFNGFRNKESHVWGLTQLLTNSDFLRNVFVPLDEADFRLIIDHAERNDSFVDLSKGGEVFVHLGIIIPTTMKIGILHQDIIQAIKGIDFETLNNERRMYWNDPAKGEPVENYNAMRLRINLVDAHVRIWREVIVPMRLNFYELHLIIQEAMGWERRHLAEFSDNHHHIFVFLFDEAESYLSDDDRRTLLGSYTQVDPILFQTGMINYTYDYGDDWVHQIELAEFVKAENLSTPYVVSHKGPVPIEDSGGVSGFEAEHNIIKDKSHPEHQETLLWAKSLNYKARYPKKSINRSLEKMFNQSFPITEFNDQSLV